MMVCGVGRLCVSLVRCMLIWFGCRVVIGELWEMYNEGRWDMECFSCRIRW